jgi:ubiquinone/menaquinone biosynthesis C-methylase UbiE
MRTSAETVDTYAMGHSEAEERRLQRQAVLLEPHTRHLFEAAGIGAGMKVLDLGSGAGDTAMLAAELVGPTGSVVGVDLNPAILTTARSRAQAAGHTNVTFLAGEAGEVPLDDDFDALVGRLILCHLPEPAATLRAVVPHLRSGGVVAFHDLDLTTDGMATPPSPLNQQIHSWVKAALAYGGVEIAAGTKMHQIFLDAGLEAPVLQVYAQIGGSRPFIEAFTAYAGDTVRTLLPLLVKGGIATEEEVGIETLAARYRAELLRQGSVVRSFLFMGGWTRKP